jgi:hypothetical protein
MHTLIDSTKTPDSLTGLAVVCLKIRATVYLKGTDYSRMDIFRNDTGSRMLMKYAGKITAGG